MKNWLVLARSPWLTAMAVGLLLSSAAWAAEGRKKAAKPEQPAVETVEMFDAIAAKQIDVKLFPKDSTGGNVKIENKTNKPLSIKLPAAFAAVPVLAQAGVGAGAAPRAAGAGGAAQPAMGGMGGMGMGGGGMGMGGGGMGGGFFNVAPEKVGQFKVALVCLEHGRPEPRAAIAYELQPIASYTTKAGVAEVGEMLGYGKINQRAAQVATWHLNNGMSLQELAAKQRRFANGTSEPYFKPEEIQAGAQVVAVALKAAEERKQPSAPSSSLGQN